MINICVTHQEREPQRDVERRENTQGRLNESGIVLK